MPTLLSTIQFANKPGLEKFLWPDADTAGMQSLHEQIEQLAINGDFDGEFGPQLVGFATRNLAVRGRSTSDTVDPDALALLVGDVRAKILRRAITPSTTTELANDLGYSPSTISHHLKALTNAEAVESHRSQWFVYYRLTDVGWQLLSLYT
ncbi:regulatory ArsR family protein [Jatrophihabitans sp. GAS493]|uniref:ArsR/SmtB family transcription factor n=1 Tax=Jatrophihabitans sp. GAS493 TaxID=1907575 RepID=UPI000BB984C3|nr:winged helix-turn-helix domain-containing protein [Jatrophihabitans sp. GAS493]SOD70639.1 regulatory ArsR family protein [Jatrophihabitans sp. GAS493]